MRHSQKPALVCVAVCALAVAGCGANRVQKAGELLKVGSTKEAREVLTEEIKANPTNADAHFLMGRVHEADKNVDEALKSFDSATKADANYKPKIGQYLWEQVKSGKSAEGASYIARAFALYPELEKNDDAAYAKYVTYGWGLSQMQKYLDSSRRDSTLPRRCSASRASGTTRRIFRGVNRRSFASSRITLRAQKRQKQGRNLTTGGKRRLFTCAATPTISESCQYIAGRRLRSRRRYDFQWWVSTSLGLAVRLLW